MVKKVIALVFVVALGAIGFTFTAATLPVGTLAEKALPVAKPPAEMTLSALPTGSYSTGAAFAFRGGSFSDERQFAATPVLIHHPGGDLLIDAGFGKRVKEHSLLQPAAARAFSSMTIGRPVVEQLKAAQYDLNALKGVVVTHAHWDHVSGIEDLIAVPVWVDAEEKAFIRDGKEPTALMRTFTAATFHDVVFKNEPYLGFPRSLDVYGDGAVVLVDAPGHTPGSIIVFVTLPSGKRFVFLGDTAWQNEGVNLPAERPWMMRALADTDPAKVRDHLSHLAAIHQRFPDVAFFAAHDVRAFQGIPVFPATVN